MKTKKTIEEYTINALSEFYELDRRTVKTMMRDIPPHRQSGRFKYYDIVVVRPIFAEYFDRRMTATERVAIMRDIEAGLEKLKAG